MKVKFYGVRGSIASPGKDTVKYGGNTSCTNISGKKSELILDAGTGIRSLGNDLMKRLPQNQIEAHLFLSHTHWDHIQGFPFFIPAYIPGNNIHIYGAKKVDNTLEETLAGQMLYQYFPISLKQMGAKINFYDINEEQTQTIHEFRVTGVKLNHPFPGVFAYRIDGKDGNSVVYATDTEHYDCPDKRLLKLAEKADALIYDAQYTPEEYKTKQSWGHSTGQKGVETAKESKVKKLILCHHDPSHTDKDIDDILESCRKIAGKDLEVIAAYEGLELDVS